jgi:general stress protein YciG
MANTDTNEKTSGTRSRGFASMDPEKQRDIASKGGQSVPSSERSFSKDPALAAEAGRKGGQSTGGNKTGRSSSKMNSSSVQNSESNVSQQNEIDDEDED